MSAYISFNTNVQQINNHNIYSVNSIYKYHKSFVEEVKQQFHYWTCNYCHHIPLHGACSELLGFHTPLIYTELWVSFFWFFILFIINNILIIVSKCNPGWLPSETCWPSMGYLSFIQKNPQILFLWGFVGITDAAGVFIGM